MPDEKPILDSFGRPVPKNVKPLSTKELFVTCPNCQTKIILWEPKKEK